MQVNFLSIDKFLLVPQSPEIGSLSLKLSQSPRSCMPVKALLTAGFKVLALLVEFELDDILIAVTKGMTPVSDSVPGFVCNIGVMWRFQASRDVFGDSLGLLKECTNLLLKQCFLMNLYSLSPWTTSEYRGEGRTSFGPSVSILQKGNLPGAMECGS
jgi:hypothetical protein